MADNGFVLAVLRDDAGWHVDRLPDGLQSDLEGLTNVLRQQQVGGIGLVDVADEFFVAIRVVPGSEVRLLLSDVTAAVEWDLARQVLAALGDDLPDDDDLGEVGPAGDVRIFSDLGLPEIELGTILDDLDLYADEMLLDVARRIGFADAFQAALHST